MLGILDKLPSRHAAVRHPHPLRLQESCTLDLRLAPVVGGPKDFFRDRGGLGSLSRKLGSGYSLGVRYLDPPAQGLEPLEGFRTL